MRSLEAVGRAAAGDMVAPGRGRRGRQAARVSIGGRRGPCGSASGRDGGTPSTMKLGAHQARLPVIAPLLALLVYAVLVRVVSIFGLLTLSFPRIDGPPVIARRARRSWSS